MNDRSHANPDPAQRSRVADSTEESLDKQSSVSALEFHRLFDGSGSLLARRLGELLPVAVYICEAPSGTITYYNSLAAAFWGSTPIDGDTDERFGSIFRFFRTDGTPLSYSETPMAQVLSGGAAVRNHELVIERPDGSRITALANIDPLIDSTGQIVGVINVFRDVTDWKVTEQASLRLAAIVESSEDAIISKDLNAIITSWNQAAEKLFGYTAEEAVGKSITILFPPDRLDEEPDILERIRRGQRIEHYETLRQRKDGSLLDIALTISPIRDAKGNIIGASKIAREITRQKQMEAALRASEEQVAAELQAMQDLHSLTTQLLGARDMTTALYQVLDASIAMHRADFGNIQVYNPAIGKLEIVAQRGFKQDFLDAFRIVGLDDESACARAMRQGKQVTIEDVEKDPAYVAYRGSAAAAGYRAVQSTPLVNRRGDLIGMLSTHFRHPHLPTDRELRMLDLYARQAADVIERLRIEDELRQSQEKLRQQAQELEQQLIRSGRLVSLGEVTASMAHEFNNPLGIIIGFVEDVISNTDPSDPNYRSLQIIDEEAKRCSKIVGDLMQVARPTNTEFCSISVHDAIDKTLQRVDSRLYKQKVMLEKKLQADLPRIYGDPQQLEQVLVNLYLNAIDAMPDGGKLSVEATTIKSDEAASTVLIAVSDTGCGIPDADLPRIFQPFFTAKKKRGLGLGLPICERIIKNHGGKIEVESQPGEGTTFKIYLPLNNAAITESVPRQDSPMV